MATIKYKNPQTGEFEDIVIDGVSDVPIDGKSYVRKDKQWSEITAESIGAITEHQDISGKENNSNKVSSWSSTTTDNHYPSEKLVKTSLDAKLNKITSSNKLAASNISGLSKVATSGSYNDLNNIPNIYTKAETNSLIYPVGSIYISVDATSPASIYGGSWERIKDTFLLSAGDSYSAGSTGGEVNHTLTVNEMPSHRHDLPMIGAWMSDIVKYSQNAYAFSNIEISNTIYGINNNYFKNAFYDTGGSQPHNNMPPYLTVYMWKRIA